jgi:hypothetical protein
MKAATDFKTSRAFALLLIGPPKSGKTTFALSFPKPWVLDCDNNLAGALRYHKNLGEPVTDFFFDDPNEEPNPDLRWSVAMKALVEAIKSPDVETIFVDGLTVLAWWLERHILANSNTSSGGMKDLVIAGEKCMNQSQWGPFRNNMVKFVMAARAVGKNFIMSCHEAMETSEDGAIIAYRPLISGQLRANLAGLFTDCWRCETGNSASGPTYSVRFQPRTLMQIGNSLQIPKPSLDVTNKKRSAVWSELSKFF